MQISYERIGGFAGLHLRTSVDTDELPPHEAEPLKDLINEAQFFDLPERLVSDESHPDRFHYRLTIQDGDRSHTVEMNGSYIPDPLQMLLAELNRVARSYR